MLENVILLLRHSSTIVSFEWCHFLDICLTIPYPSLASQEDPLLTLIPASDRRRNRAVHFGPCTLHFGWAQNVAKIVCMRHCIQNQHRFCRRCLASKHSTSTRIASRHCPGRIQRKSSARLCTERRNTRAGTQHLTDSLVAGTCILRPGQ